MTSDEYLYINANGRKIVRTKDLVTWEIIFEDVGFNICVIAYWPGHGLVVSERGGLGSLRLIAVP